LAFYGGARLIFSKGNYRTIANKLRGVELKTVK